MLKTLHFILIINFFILMPLTTMAQSDEKVSDKFIFGYDSKTVQEIGGSLNSIKITLDTFAKKINSEFTLKMFKDSEDLITNLDENKITCASLTPLTYVRYDKKNVKPLVTAIGANSEDVFVRYVLLVRSDSGFDKLEQLANLTFAKNKTEEISLLYLNTELAKKNLHSINEFFSKAPNYETQEEALYSVYFKKNAVCLITDDTLNMLIEMNPAIKDQIKVLMRSEKYIFSGLFVNKNITPELEKNLITTSLGMPLTKSGKQTLKLVRTKSLQLVKDEDFNSLRALLKEYKDITKSDYKE